MYNVFPHIVAAATIQWRKLFFFEFGNCRKFNQLQQISIFFQVRKLYEEIKIYESKVRTLWEGHKIGKKLPQISIFLQGRKLSYMWKNGRWKIYESKVKTLWEGHKIGKKNLLLVLTKQLFLLSSVKTSGRFFQTFVAFSEKLNFNLLGTYFY